MAATIVPDMPRDGRVHNPRHLSLPLQRHTLGLNEPLETPELSPGPHGPPPNPPFVFPSRPMSMSMSASTPTTARTTRRRPRSAIEMAGFAFGDTTTNDTRPSGSPALPDFSFNPGANLAPPNTITPATDSFLNAPRSPHSPRVASARAVHRRGGSEFVGGEYRSGNARMEVLSTSPTGSDNGKVSPQLRPVEPSRRGPAHRHAHRRSAAMSSHDLSTITGLNLTKNSGDASRGSSAPSSPSADLNKHFSFPMMRPDEPTVEAEKASEPKAEIPAQNEAQTPPAPTPEPVFAQRKSFSKGRVGFSDTLEFIPRPLSLVSSDTSSTVTVKPGHSLSGSISSIISASNSVIMEKDESLPCLEATPSQPGSDSRPSTAGAILEGTQEPQADASCASPLRRGSFPLLTEVTLAAPGPATSPDPSPTKVPKRWSFLDHFAGSHSPSRSRPVSLNSCEVSKTDLPSADHVKDEKAPDSEHAVPKAGKKSSKKQRKVKTWAGSILTKKPKGRHGKNKKASRRGPTPPPSRPNNEDEEDSASDSADTKSEPGVPTVMITELDHDQGGVDAWKPPRPFTEDDTSYPMIDLDAALGPFNTPLPRNPEWEAAQKAGGLVKRQLHSAAGMSRFSGPGMHYTHHQRAQSSPEMPPFEFRRGMNRFGSSSTMADVFEEEEEEVDSDDSGSSTPQPESVGPKDSEASSFTGPFSVRSSDPSIGPRRKGSDPEDGKSQRTASMKSRTSLSSLQEQVIEEEPPAIPMQFRKVEFGRPAQRKAPESPISPRAPLDGSSTHTTSSLAPVSPYSSVTQSSSLPSPRSPASYDANIICTAPSSVTDDSFQSLLMGEPGPEVRKSMDIPSISSSHSNQARENLFAQQAAQMSRPLEPGQRPASFSALAFGGRRGSLASLSRLISSSHGERSKLSTEVTYNSELEKKAKGSKSKRFSRMVQFWKPKENAQQT
ncbi:hypothetical protein VMCG_01584 [Cytospora schulzeri]|uniref:Cell wall proline rich protein n=1 Tax=Cytospora schulzeri TaxID=448051 RepID=A0A423X4R0_9PEZI|nr:hypothetical protein VMCG_01584 [Valsa malicola]